MLALWFRSLSPSSSLAVCHSPRPRPPLPPLLLSFLPVSIRPRPSLSPSAPSSPPSQLLLKTQEAAIAAIKPGVRLCDVYAAAVTVVREEAPDLLPKLTKHAGAAIGIGG